MNVCSNIFTVVELMKGYLELIKTLSYTYCKQLVYPFHKSGYQTDQLTLLRAIEHDFLVYKEGKHLERGEINLLNIQHEIKYLFINCLEQVNPNCTVFTRRIDYKRGRLNGLLKNILPNLFKQGQHQKRRVCY